MEINQVDREITDLVARKSIYGLEAILNATMRAAIDRPYIDREYIHMLVDNAINKAMKDKEEMI